MKYAATLILMAAATVNAGAVQRSISASTPTGNRVTVTAVATGILKVSNAAPGERSLPSRATVEQPDVDLDVAITHVGKYVTSMAMPDGLTASIDSRTGFLTIVAGPGKVITDDGVRKIAGGRNRLTLATTSTGAFYGAGERGHAIDLRGDTLRMYNRATYGYGAGDSRISQMNITMPLLLSSDGYAIVFDDHARAELVVSNPITYTTDNTAPVSYYFVNGASTLADVTERLTSLTGRQPLPPLWALGYITSRYGYRSQDETMGVVDTLRRAGYPLDGLVLDLYWFGKEEDMGRLDWDKANWPNPGKMMRDLGNRGINVVTISEPFVLRNGLGIDNYNVLSDSSMLLLDTLGKTQEVEIWVGKGGMFDVSNPDTRRWLSRRYRDMLDLGVDGLWGDLGEPEKHPLSGLHHNGQRAAIYHNQYGNDWSETVYNVFREANPDARSMVMMRAGTTGLQRYSVFPWSGDVSRSWTGLQAQIPIMLNTGLSGMGYMSHDVGGFAVDQANPYLPELYVRWLQLGLFSPVLRTHAQQFAEPYYYPEQKEIVEKLIKDRYRWLPYNYTLAWENAAKGYPLVRPLNFTEPSTTAYSHITDEYLWGSEVLVAPVMTEGATARDVTFPAGRWVDMNNTAKVYDGGTTARIAAPLNVIPLFARAGAFIPMADYKMDNTADYNPGRLTVNYYPVAGVESQYTMYDDNRMSATSLETGNYRLIKFTAVAGGSRITAEATGTYNGAPENIELDLVIHRAAGPATFRVNGRVIKARYDENAGTLRLHLRWPVNRQLIIESTGLKLQ